MIKLNVQDCKIWNLDNTIIEIIKVATTTNDKIIIDLMSEGPCLRSSDFYNILDNICQNFNIDKNRFVIQTPNIEEYHDEYNIKIQNNIWPNIFEKLQNYSPTKTSITYTVGCFIGRTSWERIILSAWLDKFYSKQTLLACHHNNKNKNQIDGLQLSTIMHLCPDDMHTVIDFLKTCPRKMSTEDKDYKKLDNHTQNNFKDIELHESYPLIFSELVCETFFSGLTFFPTEKTFRPIWQMTPTITFGPRNFLSNMQSSGFKTFDDYWDESYDGLQDYERIQAIQVILKKLFLLTKLELEEMYADMLPILRHNKNRLHEIATGFKIDK